jgi:hypothetical protein
MKKIINEEILRNQKLAGIISENQYNETIEEASGGKYNLNSQDNVDDMMRDVIRVLAKYVGTHSTNDAAVGNDNRVKIYNMLNSGEFQQKISQMIPPSSMHQGYNNEANQAEYFTNNPKEMSEFLNSIGMTDFNLKGEKGEPGDAMDKMFKGTTPDDINF